MERAPGWEGRKHIVEQEKALCASGIIKRCAALKCAWGMSMGQCPRALLFRILLDLYDLLACSLWVGLLVN